MTYKDDYKRKEKKEIMEVSEEGLVKETDDWL